MKTHTSRRKFIQNLGGFRSLFICSPLVGFSSHKKIEEHLIVSGKNFSSNDKIRIAGIGMGIMGQSGY